MALDKHIRYDKIQTNKFVIEKKKRLTLKITLSVI